MDTTRAIQEAVARADLILCAAIFYGRIALTGLFVIGVWTLWRKVVRKWRT